MTTKKRRTILILDNDSELEDLIKAPLDQRTADSEVLLVLVRAKDGADAASKAKNQKFDLVIIDTDAPRLMDGGFIYGLKSDRNTQKANLLIISDEKREDLPESLRRARILKKPVNATALVQAMVECLNLTYLTQKAPTPKYAVDVRLINAIIKATLHVLNEFGIQDIKMDKAIPHPATDTLLGEVSSKLDIQCPAFTGYLCISFDKQSYLEVASAMMSEAQTEITADNRDAVGEINNIIFGNSKTDLAQFGVEMTVPKVLIGSHKKIPCPDNSAGMLLPFSTPRGRFFLTVVAFPGSSLERP